MNLFRSIRCCLFALIIMPTFFYGQTGNDSDSSSLTIMLHRGWNWISFPTAGCDRNKPTRVYDLFKDMDTWPPDLLYLEYTSPGGPIMFNSYNALCGWEQMGVLTEIFGDRGYKLLIYPRERDSVTLKLAGKLTDSQTIVTLEKGNNWVSYSGLNPSYPEQCIPEEILKHLLQVKTQYLVDDPCYKQGYFLVLKRSYYTFQVW